LKICLFLEGCYPYVRGGVSSWADTFIRSNPDHEFVLWTILDLEKRRGQFKYDLPSNVVLVQENVMEAALNLRVEKNVHLKVSDREREALAQLVTCKSPDWALLQDFFEHRVENPVDFFMSAAFLDILKEYAVHDLPAAGFLDLFWTIRSMFLPLLYLMMRPIAEADLYHSLSTGYAGVLAALGSRKYNKPFVLSEHGIYTREREEEILLSEWIDPYFKPLWIAMFNMYSRFSYRSAHRVTSLFRAASKIQQEMGCSPEKSEVIGNGITLSDFVTIPAKKPDGWVDIGAIVRVHPIKDLKTLIYTFASLKHEVENVRLHIIGPVEDEEYNQECLALIDFCGVKDIIFTGVVNTRAYLEKLDFTVLTSISEGQPFAIIESLAAHRPAVSTNVGSCRELIEGGEDDHFGPAGMVVPPMDQGALLQSLLELCRNEEMRFNMGEAGQQRMLAFFDLSKMLNDYLQVYEKAVGQWQALDSN
jgi:polysaccharide biosynthesis protein PelF